MSLKVENLRARIGDSFTLHASFEVAQGQCAGLVGPSGSGKTSLLRVLAGLEPQLEGRISLDGRDLARLPTERRDIGYVFQEQALFPALTVAENAAFGLKIRGVGKDERMSMVMPWLERVGLASRASSEVTGLSGGERQRVALVRALVWKPGLLLLDEPFSALDPSLRQGVREALLELHRLWPVPMILVTHDESDLASLATARIGYDAESPQIRKFMNTPKIQR